MTPQKLSESDVDKLINKLIADAMLRARRIGYKQGIRDIAKLANQYGTIEGPVFAKKLMSIAEKGDGHE